MSRNSPVVFVLAGIRIDPDNQLPIQVLGTVGDEPVLADRGHHVLGLEHETVEISPIDTGLAPLLRNRLLDSDQGGLEPLDGLLEVSAGLEIDG